ncbi:MAG: hypothetical protein QM820_40980 [Minicystis sp.]
MITISLRIAKAPARAGQGLAHLRRRAGEAGVDEHAAFVADEQVSIDHAKR